MIAQCVVCEGRFTAKRPHAKYCSERCAKRAQRAKGSPTVPPLRRVDAGVSVLPVAPSEEGFAAETRRELESAGRLDGYLGRAAMYVARVLDGAPSDTGGGHAALVKEYVARMAAALEGTAVVETPLEKIRRERELKAG